MHRPVRGASWSSRGDIVFARNATGGLFRVSDRGGTPELVTRVDQSKTEITHRSPYFLPGTRHFMYTATTKNGEHDGVFVSSLDTGEVRQIMNDRSAMAYAERSLLFVRSGMLLVQPFDIKRLNTSGDARSLRFAEQVDRFSTSMNGVMAYRKSRQAEPSPPGWFDRAGTSLQTIDSLTGATQFSVSPDGRAIAASRSGDIWISHLDRGVVSRVTFDPAEDTSPIWSPDSSRIVFASRGARNGIYQKPTNAGAKEELLLEVPRLESIESWSPDGRLIVFTTRDEQERSIVWTLPLDGERKPFMIQSEFNIRDPRFSPDARWLAYVSDESGRNEIHIESFPGGGSKWQVSLDGGTKPRWRRDGRELFYVSPDRTLMSVAIQNSAQSVQLSMPRPVFHVTTDSYDVSADGRFLMSSAVEDKPSGPIDIVINWPSEMQR